MIIQPVYKFSNLSQRWVKIEFESFRVDENGHLLTGVRITPWLMDENNQPVKSLEQDVRDRATALGSTPSAIERAVKGLETRTTVYDTQITQKWLDAQGNDVPEGTEGAVLEKNFWLASAIGQGVVAVLANAVAGFEV